MLAVRPTIYRQAEPTVNLIGRLRNFWGNGENQYSNPPYNRPTKIAQAKSVKMGGRADRSKSGGNLLCF